MCFGKDWLVGYANPALTIYQGQLSKMVLEQVGLTPCQFFYFFFAAFTGFFAFAFLTIFNMKIYFIAL